MSAARTVRVFVSSTFEDLRHERNILQEEVYPDLSRLCESHGARFHAIDLRWGVRDEAAHDHRTMEICLGEIARCQQTGIKPNFLILLGQRYGWRPLPAVAAATEFERLLAYLDTPDGNVVRAWYQRDDNAIPAQYLLKPRADEFKDDAHWQPVERRLGDLLAMAARGVGLTGADAAKYTASATHQEILKGLGDSEESRRHVLAFCRKGGEAQEDAPLRDLKEELRTLLGDRLVSYRSGDMTTLCAQVRDRLSAVITSQLLQLTAEPSLNQEKDAHAAFANDRSRHFQGRVQALGDIRAYLESDDRRPLIIEGPGGSGKSALIARAAAMAKDAHPTAVIVTRFVGATPAASSGASLLNSIRRELGQQLGISTPGGPVYHETVLSFADALARASTTQPIVVFVDALDQLTSDDPARALDWLPSRLPPHCKVVVSTIESRFAVKGTARVAINGLSVDEATDLLTSWLAQERRTLNPEQHKNALEAIERCRLPLYLRLVFEEVRRWRSFDPLDRCAVGAGLGEAIDLVLDRVGADANHGRTIVAHGLGYLSASRHGLTEDEVVTLLSRDDIVWDDFERRARHDPPTRRLPAIVWSRLYADLARYFFERVTADGVLIAFYHRQFIERFEATRTTPKDRAATHLALAAFFKDDADPRRDGTWQGPRARSRRELLFHYVQAQESATVVRLLRTLVFLNARVRDRDLHGLLADYELVPLHDEAEAWRTFVRRHSHALTGNPESLVSLVNHEGSSHERDQVDERAWPFPWIRTRPEPRPSTTAVVATGLGVDVWLTRESAYTEPKAYASDRTIVFGLDRLGLVKTLEGDDLRERPGRLTIAADRPVRLISAPDASSLLVFFETGVAEWYRWELDGGGRPVATLASARCTFTLPEIDDPVVDWHHGGYWFQARDGMLARLDGQTGAVTEERLPLGEVGELAALHHFRNGERFVATRQPGAIVLTGSSGGIVKRARTDLYASCTCEGHVAMAFTDGELVVFDAATLQVAASTQSGVVRGAVGWDGRYLLWFQENEGLRAWRPSAASAETIHDAEQIVPAALHVSPRAWCTDGSDRTLLVATHRLVRFRVLGSGSDRPSRVESLLGGRVWRCVRSREREQWLWEGRPCREVPLGSSIQGRLHGAVDGKDLFYAVEATGRGTVYQLDTLNAVSMRRLPLGVNVSAADPDEGCWIVDRLGHIYYIGPDGQCDHVESVALDDVHGSVIHVCGDFLLWRGYAPYWREETGMEQGRTFIVFRRHLAPTRRLERLGERKFAVRDGVCAAVEYLPASGRIVMMWQYESREVVMRLTTVMELLDARWTDIPTEDVHGDISQIAVAVDESVVGVLAGGTLSCLDLASGRLMARLEASAPFTHIAAGPDGSDFWLGEARDRIFHCRVERPR